ncbi:MAG: hypothetical protein QW117_00600 [Candidatus Pacearchaeota archaeon]
MEKKIYLKKDFYEVIKSKKDLLGIELSLIKILQIIKRYSFLRKKEILLKIQIKEKLKNIHSEINYIFLNYLPKIEEKSEDIKKNKKTLLLKDKKEIKNKDVLELELREIQRKLKELENF